MIDKQPIKFIRHVSYRTRQGEHVYVHVLVCLSVRAQQVNMLRSWREQLYVCTTCSVGA